MKNKTSLEGAYDPTATEEGWYQWWKEQGFFHADANSDKEPFTIVIPPPNVTGSLHMGHALTMTIQDILVRFKRMDGYEALWLPGTDHAGIATQVLVERMLRAQGVSRHELGREAFLEKVWEWKDRYGGRIEKQLERIGSSLDWERNRFTMDEGLSVAVREVFVRLYEEGLIYRAERLVNWDPEAMTVLSSLEVEQEEEDGHLWHISYPLEEDPSRSITVATTRPETMLGDAAVAVHPEDERYQDLIGKMLRLPLSDRLIPVVADGLVAKPEFGSGAVKITPAHDFNDWECGQRNGLEIIQVIGFDARVTDAAPERYRGMTREEARKAVVADLEAAGRLVKIEPHKYMPGRSQRSGVIVEPLPMEQWFVKMDPLAEPAVQAVRDGRIKFVPETWEKVYYHWMENIRDWCISRQLWWGHRIPAWYGPDDKVFVAHSEEEAQAAADAHYGQATALRQDEDVLDTWFSSGLWAFSTLGWPDMDAADLKKFYPTSVMETGFDIIFFWVARMIFFGLHFMDEVPFKTVFLHAMVRDRNGDKMSKTKGNVIDPLHVIDGVLPAEVPEDEINNYRMLFEEFPEGVSAQGADALRFTLAVYAAQGRDIRLDIKRVEGYRAFLNKLWNASKFAMMHLEQWEPQALDAEAMRLTPADRWILGRLQIITQRATDHLEAFQINEAAQALYQFVWGELCDWYIELSKAVLYEREGAQELGDAQATRTVLAHVLEQTLRLLHPIIPFVTEEIWHVMPKVGQEQPSLCISSWPRANEALAFAQETADVELAVALISRIRTIRGETNVKPSTMIEAAWFFCDDEARRAQMERVATYLKSQANITALEIHPSSGVERPGQSATALVEGVEIHIPLGGLIDIEEETARLKKAIAKADKDIQHVKRKLENPRFVSNAPTELVDKERARLGEFEARKAALETSLQQLSQL